jgi:HK97 gp10 family phage protein
MPTRGVMEFKALTEWLEDFAAAGQSVDDAVRELLIDAQPFVVKELERNLRGTSEQWTPALALTIEATGVQQQGNYIFVEVTAGAGDEEAANAKEFGTARQAAEPFFRPTFRGHLLKNKLKAGMKALLERYGIRT